MRLAAYDVNRELLRMVHRYYYYAEVATDPTILEARMQVNLAPGACSYRPLSSILR